MQLTELSAAELEVVRSKSMFQGFGFKFFERRCKNFAIVTVEQGFHLFRAGDAVNGLFLVLSGILSLTTSRKALTHHGTIEPGQLLGDFELLQVHEQPTFLVSAYAAEDCRAIFIPRSEVEWFYRAANRNALASMALRMAFDACRKAQRTVERFAIVGHLAPENGAHLLSEAIDHLLGSGHAVKVSEACLLVQQRRAIPAKYHTLREWTNELRSAKVIRGYCGQGKSEWVIDREKLSEYLGRL